MSQATSASASTSSPSFQSMFYAALKAYEKKTKNDLIAHPLAAQLQACKSPGDILSVLQDKVKEFDQSRSADERLSQWLNPTINVLYSFSATLGAGVGLVSTVKSTSGCLLLPLITDFVGILACIRHLLWYWGSPPGERLFGYWVGVILTTNFLTDGQGRRSQPRSTHRSLRAYRELLQAPRISYSSAANRCND
jgi:hypothetical protein